jgi:hypothetical protein
MQPPIRLTGEFNIDIIIFAAGLLIAFYWFRALRLAREGARLFFLNLTKSVIMFCFSAVGLTSVVRLPPEQAQVFSFFIAFAFLVRWQGQKRSRYISQKTKRAVIARDLKGEKFDSTKHHIDHVWPFARGGSHTEDNLRVIDKKRNLQKGAKRPRFRDMW